MDIDEILFDLVNIKKLLKADFDKAEHAQYLMRRLERILKELRKF